MLACLWIVWYFSALPVEQKLVHINVITDIKSLWASLLLLI